MFREIERPSPEFALTGSLQYTESGSGGEEEVLLFRDRAVLEVVTPLERLDATLRVAGCRTERLENLAPRTRVQLRGGYPVRLALPSGVELPGPPLAIGVSIAEDEGDAPEGAMRFFDEHGEVSLHVYEPGRFRLQWFVERRARTA